ncbi:hypothetical protein [Actinomadura sp. 6K520]|uniref:hypothetical protein n=1 Tax=Actinomadura sp. 6K520 TaxID=2530364 RepID=UPI00104A1E80|nr:hypothetical protein [Actinomadura sp. 6K520]TDE16980.1 hypothetical protein E1289_36305 [Actinomadura sp. 6K520]
MSRRKLTLLGTATALVVAGGVTAASVSLAAPAPPPGRPGDVAVPSVAPPSAADAAAPSVSPRAASGKEADSPAECRDADCEIEIRDGMEIPLNGKRGVRQLKIKIDGTQVTITARTENGRAVAVTDASNHTSVTHINGLKLRPHVAGDGRLMLSISHG